MSHQLRSTGLVWEGKKGGDRAIGGLICVYVIICSANEELCYHSHQHLQAKNSLVSMVLMTLSCQAQSYNHFYTHPPHNNHLT